MPARNALLADVVTPAAYGRAYGFERAMDNLGAVGGPLLALALVAAFDVRTAIALSVIPGLLAVAAIVYAIRSTPRPQRQDRIPLRIRVKPVMQGRLGRLMVGIGAFEIGNIAATLLILRATDLLEPGHGQDAAVQIALLLYAGYNLAATIASVPAGRPLRSPRPGARPVRSASRASLLAYAGFAGRRGRASRCWRHASQPPASRSAASRRPNTPPWPVSAPADLRGSAFGLLAAVQSFGNLAASAVAGVLWTAVSPAAGLLFAAVMMVAALACLARSARRSRLTTRSPRGSRRSVPRSTLTSVPALLLARPARHRQLSPRRA